MRNLVVIDVLVLAASVVGILSQIAKIIPRPRKEPCGWWTRLPIRGVGVMFVARAAENDHRRAAS